MREWGTRTRAEAPRPRAAVRHVDPPLAQAARPTSIRWVILLLLFAVSFVAYVHRLNFNVAGHFMMKDLGFSKAQLGWMISAFIACYTIFQIPLLKVKCKIEN